MEGQKLLPLIDPTMSHGAQTRTGQATPWLQARSSNCRRRSRLPRAEIATLQQELADPDLYRRDPRSFQTNMIRIAVAQAEIETVETEWLKLKILKENLSS